MSFKLTYNLRGAGWATVRIEDGRAHLDITASYLNDSLRELAEAARALASGADSARIVFMDEPGEIQLSLQRAGDSLQYEARWFDDWSSRGIYPADKFRIVLSGTTTVRTFVDEVRTQLGVLLRDHGAAGYRMKWIEHPFPEELLLQLQRLSASRRRRPAVRSTPRVARQSPRTRPPPRDFGLQL
jgi:hypothetical protein